MSAVPAASYGHVSAAADSLAPESPVNGNASGRRYCGAVHASMCYTEKAPNAWHRRGTQNTGNTYNQRKRPSTDTPHRPSTKHYRKGSPGDA